MANRLKGKLLKYSDQHQDCCFLTIYDALYLIIATKENRLSIYSVDGDVNDLKDDDDDDDDDQEMVINDYNLNIDCIIDNITINYDSKIKQIMKVNRYGMCVVL